MISVKSGDNTVLIRVRYLHPYQMNCNRTSMRINQTRNSSHTSLNSLFQQGKSIIHQSWTASMVWLQDNQSPPQMNPW